MTKADIINKFLNDQSDNLPCANYKAFSTNFVELGKMYEAVKEVMESETSWDDFLKLEGALTMDGRVRQDREYTGSFEDESKKTKRTITTKVVFKYFVFNWFKKQIEENQNYGKSVAWEGIQAASSNRNYLTNFAKGLKTGKPEKIKDILNSARQKYATIK